ALAALVAGCSYRRSDPCAASTDVGRGKGSMVARPALSGRCCLVVAVVGFSHCDVWKEFSGPGSLLSFDAPDRAVPFVGGFSTWPQRCDCGNHRHLSVCCMGNG